MAVALPNSTPPISWSPWPQTHSTAYAAHYPYQDVIPPKNEKEMTREMLVNVLEYMSTVLEREFGGTPIRLVAHGGACMLLHPGLFTLSKRKALYHAQRGEIVAMRWTTRDVDYIRRSFISEYTPRFPDAIHRLQKCIRATAVQFGLGADWMNADPDVALPLATDPTTNAPFDPIYNASIQPNNIHEHTVFTSKNKKLTVINVTPAWAVALKLIRYLKRDPEDICLLLLNGIYRSNVAWTAEKLMHWLKCDCAAMNYQKWDIMSIINLKSKIKHAVEMVTTLGKSMPPASAVENSTVESLQAPPTRTTLPHPPAQSPSPLDRLSPNPSSTLATETPLPRPLGPSSSWNSATSSQHKLPDSGFATIPSSSWTKQEHKKPRNHLANPSITNSPWYLRSLEASQIASPPIPAENTIRRSRSTGFELSSSYHNLPSLHSRLDEIMDQPLSKEGRHHADKHLHHRKEKNRRIGKKAHSRQLEWEIRDSRIDGYSHYSDYDSDSSDATDLDTDADTDSDSEELDLYRSGSSDQPATYIPMPEPPAVAHTPEWQENERRRQEQQRAENAKLSRSSADRRYAFHDNPSRPHHSQTWPSPGPSRQQSPLHMSIYSSPPPHNPGPAPLIPLTSTSPSPHPYIHHHHNLN